jgi:hypothetical protein
MKPTVPLYLLLSALFFTNIIFAQVKGTEKDTTNTTTIAKDNANVPKKKDTTLYNNIQKFSKKSKVGRLLHKAIFARTRTKNSNPIRGPKNREYKKYEGKIIRNIKIETLDPFGYSVTDTTKKPKNWAEETGNKLHLKSKEFAIRNLTLLKKNTPLDSLLVRETERLIRNQRFVRQVFITVEPAETSADSIDVVVRVLDSWSIIPKGSVSPNRTRFELIDRNLFGTGSEFANKVVHESESGKTAYSTRFIVPTIKSSYIRTSLQYRLELDNSYGKSISIERRFFSAFTKWSGGIYVDQQFRIDSLDNNAGNFALQNFKYNSQDVWAGRAFQLFEGQAERNRTTNFILATRFLHTDFTESPTLEYDSTHFYSGENFVMTGFGISTRQFVEDAYLFNYGIIEDVPVGRIFNITAGYQQKNQQGRLYLGGRASFGNYYKFGYLSTNFEYGTFFNNRKLEQSAFSMQANYFTNLKSIGSKWKMRQFIKPQVVLGWNRINIKGDQISINENSSFQGENGAGFQGNNSFGIRGYNSEVFGTKKVLLSLQTQFYSPWDLWGFRVNPYFNFTTAVLGSEKRKLLKSPLYSSVVVGVIISNDYLVLNSFQFSLAYYPSIPGQGTHIFTTNSFETEDFGFQDFELGKPRTILYQ